MIYSCHGVLHSNKNKQSAATHKNMSGYHKDNSHTVQQITLMSSGIMITIAPAVNMYNMPLFPKSGR